MQHASQHLAEFNFGTLKYDWDDPRVAEFTDNLDRVNAIAEASPGFVWRMDDDNMDEGQNDIDGVFDGNGRAASTLSVWKDAASLHKFVWKTVHGEFFRKRRDWFAADGNSNLVLWWVPAGHKPTLKEGMERFEHLMQNGETDYAFGWKHLSHFMAAAETRRQYA